MSEHIIEKAFRKDGYKWYTETIEREEIIRCRDCKHYTYSSWHRCDLYSIAHEVEPNGFCAWGERK